jgi:hypothetical protein
MWVPPSEVMVSAVDELSVTWMAATPPAVMLRSKVPVGSRSMFDPSKFIRPDWMSRPTSHPSLT